MQFDPSGFAGVVGHQSAILLPFLFFSFVYFIYRICRKYGIRFGRIPDRPVISVKFFYPVVSRFFFYLFCLLGKIKLDDARLYYRYYLGMPILE